MNKIYDHVENWLTNTCAQNILKEKLCGLYRKGKIVVQGLRLKNYGFT
jgi:hypothetical protein